MTAAGVIALLALAVAVASLGYLHLAPTGLSPVRNAVSQYGITSFRAGYRAATISFGAAGIALAVGIGLAIGGRGEAVVALLAVFAIARAAISWFPMDAPGADRTPTGQMHGLLAIGAFACATLAAFRLASVLSHQDRWHSLVPVSAALGGAMAACLLVMALARAFPAIRARFGAIERGFYLSAIAWFAVFAVACATS
ncbi:MAG: DUF998 domain-containing protein [Streptosporangiaceae bacterium]